ncbi:hypothetical protein NW766_007452 [Fusarium irregulare]|uniref:Uncharacterized protein n=1 Tax=Fusarium irregulare TaxID=2494466 RepID=A0A9W8PMU1_9HYPO|nr:hypothetical protein NW766_007452 [Fusarium irregulare]
MANRKLKGPSHFCEWVVGTTIESALGPIPKSKPPKNKKREVVRVEVTTDDESEEDTVRITYPRTGRTVPPSPPDPEPESEPEPEPAPVVTQAKTVIKKVRFEDGPVKSALKQTVITTPVESSDETSESEPESDSSQSETISSSDATDSDAESSETSPKKKRKKRKKKRQKQKQIETDSESDWDSDPDPTCKCHKCVKGREILRRIGKKKNKDYIPPSPETSESEAEEPPKHNQQTGKKKKKGARWMHEPELDSDAYDSAKDTSESDTPPLWQQRQFNRKQSKKQGKQKGKKQQEPVSEPETSDSEPEPPWKGWKNKKQQQKANAKKGGKKGKKFAPDPEPDETDGESSETAKESEDEVELEEEPKQQSKAKQKNNKKQGPKQASNANKQTNKKNKKQKADKKANKEPEDPKETEAEEKTSEGTKEQDQGKFRKMGGKEKAQPRYRDGVKKGNYPEGLPGPHMRRPQLIEPIRAQVVQTERVIETPEDPAPNAYYDPEHNVMRVYHGPVYGNHQSNALYPDRNGFTRPLPMGTPHPMHNPFYYGFNNPKEYPHYAPMSPYHQQYAGVPPPDAYSHVPITQGMSHPPWYAMGGPPGPPPGPPQAPASYGPKTAPASNKDKVSQNNNVGPPSLTGKDNPYLPKRYKQCGAWGSQGARTASKEHSQPSGSVRAASNTWGGSNNNDQGNTWDNNNSNDQGNNWNSSNNNDPGSSWDNDGVGDQNTQNDQVGWGTTDQDNSNGNNGGGGDEQNNSWGSNTNENQVVTEWSNGDNGGTQETAPNSHWDPVQRWSTESNKSNETVRNKGAHWGNDTYPGASGDWDQSKDGVSSVGQGADNNVGVCGANDGNANGNGNGNGNGDGQPASSAGDNPDNVMPGTWVETPAVTAPWGDPSAAQDTNGAADVW